MNTRWTVWIDHDQMFQGTHMRDATQFCAHHMVTRGLKPTDFNWVCLQGDSQNGSFAALPKEGLTCPHLYVIQYEGMPTE